MHWLPSHQFGTSLEAGGRDHPNMGADPLQMPKRSPKKIRPSGKPSRRPVRPKAKKGKKSQAQSRVPRPRRFPLSQVKVGGAVRAMPAVPRSRREVVSLAWSWDVLANATGTETNVKTTITPNLFPIDKNYSAIYRRRRLISAELEFISARTLRHDGTMQMYFDFHDQAAQVSYTYLQLLQSTSPQIKRCQVSDITHRMDLRSRLDSALHQEVDSTQNVFSMLGDLAVFTSVRGYIGDTGENEIIGSIRILLRVQYADPVLEVGPSGPEASVTPPAITIVDGKLVPPEEVATWSAAPPPLRLSRQSACDLCGRPLLPPIPPRVDHACSEGACEPASLVSAAPVGNPLD